jgi:hypothetical protein
MQPTHQVTTPSSAPNPQLPSQLPNYHHNSPAAITTPQLRLSRDIANIADARRQLGWTHKVTHPFVICVMHHGISAACCTFFVARRIHEEPSGALSGHTCRAQRPLLVVASRP